MEWKEIAKDEGEGNGEETETEAELLLTLLSIEVEHHFPAQSNLGSNSIDKQLARKNTAYMRMMPKKQYRVRKSEKKLFLFLMLSRLHVKNSSIAKLFR